MLQTEHFNISITYISFRNNSIYSLSNMLRNEHKKQLKHNKNKEYI